jgi:hypothetical protein
MRAWFFALLLTYFAAVPCRAADFCSDMAKIASGAASAFKQLKGFRAAGAETCETVQNGFAFNCQWPVSTSRKVDSAAALAARTAQCFGVTAEKGLILRDDAGSFDVNTPQAQFQITIETGDPTVQMLVIRPN